MKNNMPVQPVVALIVAMDLNRAIGKENQLPWRLPSDLARFKKLTMGSPIIMGRKTYDSIGKPLPGRLNVVLSRQEGLDLPEGAVSAPDYDAAYTLALAQNPAHIFIIGGEQIFRQTLKFADVIYLTVVQTRVDAADAHFPEFPEGAFELLETEHFNADARNEFAFSFEKWQRLRF
ncbi:MAG: dihydrofolate reductase [Bacteroidota bacterium]